MVAWLEMGDWDCGVSRFGQSVHVGWHQIRPAFSTVGRSPLRFYCCKYANLCDYTSMAISILYRSPQLSTDIQSYSYLMRTASFSWTRMNPSDRKDYPVWLGSTDASKPKGASWIFANEQCPRVTKQDLHHSLYTQNSPKDIHAPTHSSEDLRPALPDIRGT